MVDQKPPKSSRLKPNRRKPAQQPRDWKKLFHRGLSLLIFGGGTLLAVSGGMLAARLACDSTYFRVADIRVLHASRITAEEVLELSDICPGMNMFTLDLDLIGRKLEENPWIATARVERVFPRQIVIHLSEHEPQAVVNLGYLYYVDGAGTIFKLLDARDPIDYPMVTGIERQFFLDHPRQAGRLLGEAMTLLQALQARTVFGLPQVSELHIDAAEGFDLYTYRGGIPVRMGFKNFADKLDRLERIFSELEPRLTALKYIDLNVVDRVIVKVDTSLTQNKGETPGGRVKT